MAPGTAGRSLRTPVKNLSSTRLLHMSSEMIYNHRVGVYRCPARRCTDHW